jgi:hypothetical protein
MSQAAAQYCCALDLQQDSHRQSLALTRCRKGPAHSLLDLLKSFIEGRIPISVGFQHQVGWHTIQMNAVVGD